MEDASNVKLFPGTRVYIYLLRTNPFLPTLVINLSMVGKADLPWPVIAIRQPISIRTPTMSVGEVAQTCRAAHMSVLVVSIPRLSTRQFSLKSRVGSVISFFLQNREE